MALVERTKGGRISASRLNERHLVGHAVAIEWRDTSTVSRMDAPSWLVDHDHSLQEPIGRHHDGIYYYTAIGKM
jgi:hypothetical protein